MLRFVLEKLGLRTDNQTEKNIFYLGSKVESVTENDIFQHYLVSCHGAHNFSTPYRRPAKEIAFRLALNKVGSQLDLPSLPPTAWPGITRAQTE